MGKVSQKSSKYLIEAKLESTGLVEKPDIVGAIFGQTEGLLGEELDLRELQERGRVGRIDVTVEEKDGRSEADIKIPSSLDATETALLGASLETIERVGPTNADISVEQIKDQRTSKRDYIVKRAKQLLQDIEDDKPEKNKIADEIKQEIRTSELSEYRGFKAGPEAGETGEIILVEGRADLLNLLKHGVKNGLALGGTSVPQNVELLEDETITAFLDGDRGGDLILKELKEKTDPDYVARAPENKEVEELGKEDLYKSLRDKEPAKFSDADEAEEEERDEETLEEISEQLDQLVGTRAVFVMDESYEIEYKFPVDKLDRKINKVDDCMAVVVDAEIDRDIVEAAEDRTEYIAGMDKTGYANSSKAEILTRKELNSMKPEQ